MSALRTSRFSWLTVNFQLRCPIWGAVVRRKVFCCRARTISAIDGGSHSILSSDGLELGTLCVQLPFCAKLFTETGRLSKLSITYSGKSSLSGLPFLPEALVRDNSSGAWCFMLARCATSKVEFREFGTPSWEWFSRFCNVEGPIEDVMICAYIEVIPFDELTGEKYRLHYHQIFVLRGVITLSGVGEQSGPLPNRFHRVMRLTLQERTAKLNITCIFISSRMATSV